jgi:hypothetical protein
MLRDGKQKYMASAAEAFSAKFNITIARNTTLLIDDDHNNVRLALEQGVRALWFIPDEPEK